MSNERERRYAEAIHTKLWNGIGYDSDPIVRAVMAVADAEQAELRAEVERLQRLTRDVANGDGFTTQLGHALIVKCDDRGQTDLHRRAEVAEAKVADAWDEGYIHGRQLQADATADEARALTSTPVAVRVWLANTARSLRDALRSAKGSIHDNPYRAAPETTEGGA